MELDRLLDDTWYLFDVYVQSYEPEKVFCLNLVHEIIGWDYSLEIKLSDVLNDNKTFAVSGNSEVKDEVITAFAGQYWDLVKNIVIVLNACDAYEEAKSMLQKATLWDQLQQLSAPVPVLPTIEEACKREDIGLSTELDEFLVQFHVAGCEDSFRAYTAKLVEWLLPGKASVPLEISKSVPERPSNEKNSHIRIFEVQVPSGELHWVAAETLWKAVLCYLDNAEEDCMCLDTDIKNVVELPREMWGEYFVFFSDKKRRSFRSMMQRLRKFPQTICTSKGSEEYADITNTPLP